MYALAKSTPGDLTCSENMAYDTVGSTLKMSAQAEMTCSEISAYASVSNTKEDITITSSSHSAVYDEVQLKN